MNEYTREDTSGLALFARLLAREGKRDELVQVLEEAVALGAEHERNAPLSVDIFLSPSNPDLVLLHEHWPNSEGLAEHRANYQSIPAYGEMHDRLNALLAKPIEVVERATPVVRFTRTNPDVRALPWSSDGKYRKEALAGIVLVARVHAKPGKGPELLARLEEAIPPQAVYEVDPGLVLDFGTSAAGPDTIVFYKHYPTLASRDEHAANSQQHSAYRDVVLRINALLAKPIEVVEQMTPIVKYTRTPKAKEKG